MKTLEEIAQGVYDLHETSKAEVFKKTRKKEVITIRYIIYAIASEYLYDGKGCWKMAKYSGQDHSSISAALRKVKNELLPFDKDFRSEYTFTVSQVMGDKKFILKKELEDLQKRIIEINLELLKLN